MTITYGITGGDDRPEWVVEKLVSLFKQRIRELSTPSGISWSNFVKHIFPYFRDAIDILPEEARLEYMNWTIQNICKACDYLDIDMSINIDLIKNEVKIDINTEEAIREAYNSFPSSREINFDGKHVKVIIDIEKE